MMHHLGILLDNLVESNFVQRWMQINKFCIMLYLFPEEFLANFRLHFTWEIISEIDELISLPIIKIHWHGN
jgi:hypothetical protein